MGNLSSFLSQNALPVENIRHAVSKRFVDGDGKPVEWEITCITSTEDEEIKKSCTRRVPVPGKRNQYQPDTDIPAYLGKLAARCTVYPDLNDKELQDSYHVMGADALLKTMLTPGEYTNYLLMIQEVNGFDATFDDQVEEAKN